MLNRIKTIRLAVVFGLLVGAVACNEAPTQPSQTQIQTPTPPTPTSGLSQFAGVWNVTLRLTDVKVLGGDGGCVADTMQSQIGVPNQYSLSITNKDVTLTNASGEYACTFPPTADTSGFTTEGVQGYFTCRSLPQTFHCDNGTAYSLIPIAQDITGRVSGTEISGTWDADWISRTSLPGTVMTKAQFTGSKSE